MSVEESKPDKRDGSFRVSEALLIALAPAISYYLAHTYESAYCQMYYLPTSIVQVELSTVLLFLGMLIGLLFTIIILINSFMMIFRFDATKIKNPVLKVILGNYLIFIFGIAILIIYKSNKTGLLLFATIIFFLFILHFLPALIFRKTAPTLGERVDIFIGQSVNARTAFDVISERFGRHVVLLLMFVVVVGYLAGAMGRSEAENKYQYLTPEGYSNMYVARIYGDKAFCVSVDNVSHVVHQGFTIINISNKPEIKFNMVITGKFAFTK